MKKILWLMVSCLMALSLVMAACASPATTTPTTTAPTSTTPTTAASASTAPAIAQPTQQPVQQKPNAPSAEAPKYGGTLDVAVSTSPSLTGFWPSVYEQFMGNDWTRGAGGSGVTDFNAGIHGLADQEMPLLSESWQMPDPGTWILNIRHGVHWQMTGTAAGNFMNGREMTAADVVNSWNWQISGSPKSWIWYAQPVSAQTTSINQTGPWQVTIKVPGDYLTAWGWVIQGAGFLRTYPYDLEKQFNHQLIYQGVGWPYQEAVGTGPYYVSEVVAGSETIYKRNPRYWQTDPVGPGKGNQLPYIDTYVELSIPDLSTQAAALRTGKIAFMTGLTQDSWKREMSISPNLKYANYLPENTLARFINMRTDKKDSPFSDVRVRQALMMATDFNAIKNGYYGGAAEIDVFPLNKNYAGTGYLPLSQMPQSVQDLYTYNPDKAKQLLKAAGYPDGFKSTILVSALGTNVDEVSMFKDMWAKVGVNLVIDVRDSSTFTTMAGQRSYPDMIYNYLWTSWPWIYSMTGFRGPNTFNYSYINDPPGSDPTLEKYFNLLDQNMMRDMPKVYSLMEEVRPYFMGQAYAIPRPTPYMYNVWQPWLKNFYGFFSNPGTIPYHWIDQDLKKSMGQ